MARSKRRRQSKKRKQKRMPTEIIGISLILLSILAIGRFGFIGVGLANIYRMLVGETYIILGGLLIILGGYLLFAGKHPKYLNKRLVGGYLLYLSGMIWIHIDRFYTMTVQGNNINQEVWQIFVHDLTTSSITRHMGGGMIGSVLYTLLMTLVGRPGVYLIILLMLFIGIMSLGDFSYKLLLDRIKKFVIESYQTLDQWVHNLNKAHHKKQTKRKAKINQQRTGDEVSEDSLVKDIEQASQKTTADVEDEQTTLEIETFETIKQQTNTNSESDNEDVDFEVSEEENEDYKLPPLSLLKTIPLQDQSDEYSTIEANVKKLEKTFQSFGVAAKVVKANLGPAVTKYEIQPETGVKVSKIVSLSNDIALALAAKDIRMEAPIPGKAVIGIEVPNSSVSMVSFREIIEGSPRNKNKLLEVPVGRDIAGNVQLANLEKMPHLLIAGATGSGKSVGINGIISSILIKAKPNEVKLMMIDPKMVELNIYNGIPHLLTPVVTNPKKAAKALNKVVQEMERRYEMFAGLS